MRGRNPGSFITKDEVVGGKMAVPENPPDITYQPWMPLNVVMRSGGDELKVTVDSLHMALVSQIDPLRHAFRADTDRDVNSEGGPILQMRLRSVRAWNLTGHMIALSANDLTDNTKSNTDCLCGLVDTGSSAHTPAVGYKYPISHSDIVLRRSRTDKDDPLFHIITPAGDSTIIYVNIFWRCEGPAKFSGFTRSMLAVVNQINDSAKRIDRNALEIKRNALKQLDQLDKIAEHTNTSIGSTIIKGAEVVAPYVLTAAAADDVARTERLIRGIERLGDDASASSFERVEECPEF